MSLLTVQYDLSKFYKQKKKKKEKRKKERKGFFLKATCEINVKERRDIT
jgi:hypothetical protein